MKDKTIRNNHYEYANQLVKILGFVNLADFESSIQYDTLKKNQKKICVEFNKTIDEFKKLFMQEGFDLRKINYSFENIDQIIGFIKKLLTYLGIPWDYSRKNNIPTLRLIPQNNLYNKYIMNLRNIPQNCNLDYIQEKNQLEKRLESDKLHSIEKPTQILTNDVISMNGLLNKFDKNKITKKYIIGNKIFLNKIQMDWIEKINIHFVDNNKELPQNTIISLFVGDKEMILYKYNNKKINAIKINIPNNFIYINQMMVYLKIILPGNNAEYLENTLEFEVEFNGYNILNKNTLITNIDLENNIIKFDHDNLFSKNDFDLGIYQRKLVCNVSNYFKKNNDENQDISNNNSENVLSMKNIMCYLKKPFEKKYIANNLIDLHNLTNFTYFKWIKIRTLNGNKLSYHFNMELIIGGDITINYKISPDMIFDANNYCMFEIDFPNNILYKYHEIRLKLSQKNNNSTYYDVIICGCDFLSTVPKMIFRSKIIFDHDPKWYVEGEKEYFSVSGIIGNKVFDKKNDSTITNVNVSCVDLFKMFQEKNIIDIFNTEMPFDDKKIETCFFIKTNLNNTMNPLFFLYDKNLKKYLQDVNLLLTDTYSIGAHADVVIDKDFYLCEIDDESFINIHYLLPRSADMIKYICIFNKNLLSELKYKISMWIKHDSHMIHDFGTMDVDKKIRLDIPNNKILNMLNQTDDFYLVIYVHKSYFTDWKNIDISAGLIYTDGDIRKGLALLEKYRDVKII